MLKLDSNANVTKLSVIVKLAFHRFSGQENELFMHDLLTMVSVTGPV